MNYTGSSLTDVAQIFADELQGVAFRGELDVYATVFVHFQRLDLFTETKSIGIGSEIG